MSDSQFTRRDVVKGILTSVVVAPAAAAVLRAEAAEPVKLDEKDPQAMSLGYTHDATKVNAANNPTYKPGQKCANCLQLQGKEGDQWRPCNIFAGKLVNANGWCKVWVKKA